MGSRKPIFVPVRVEVRKSTFWIKIYHYLVVEGCATKWTDCFVTIYGDGPGYLAIRCGEDDNSFVTLAESKMIEPEGWRKSISCINGT